MKILIIDENHILGFELARMFSRYQHEVVLLSSSLTDDDSFEYRLYHEPLDFEQFDLLYRQKQFNQVIYVSQGQHLSMLLKILSLNQSYDVSHFTYLASIEENHQTLCETWRNSGMSILSLFYTNVFTLEEMPILTQELDYVFISLLSEQVFQQSLRQVNEDLFIYSGQTFKPSEVLMNLKQHQNPNIQETDAAFIKEKSRLMRTTVKVEEQYDPLFLKRYEESRLEKSNKQPQRKKGSSFVLVLKPYVVNLLLFIGLILVQNSTVFGKQLDFAFLYIMMIGLIFGCRQSILSAVLVDVLFICYQLTLGISFFNILMLNDSLVQLLMYGLVGVLSGYYTDRRVSQVKQVNQRFDRSVEKYEFLNELYEETYVQKKALEKRVVSSRDSFAKVYEMMKELDSLQSSYILKKSLSIFEEQLNLSQVVIYSCHNQYLRLEVKSNTPRFEPSKSLHLSQFDEKVMEILQQGKVFVNHKLNPLLPAMIVPLLKNQELSTLIFLGDLKFDQMTLFTQHNVYVMAKLIQESLNKAYQFEVATDNSRYIEGTSILQPDSLMQLLETMDVFKANQQLDYSVVTLKPLADLRVMSKLLQKVLRQSDYVGMDDHQLIHLVLPNASKTDTIVVLNRLEHIEELSGCVIKEG